MEAKLSPVNRTDQLDVEAFKDMLESAPFRHFMARVAQELQRALSVTERAEEVLAIRRAQGAAAAIRTVLGLPEQLLGELKAKARGRSPL